MHRKYIVFEQQINNQLLVLDIEMERKEKQGSLLSNTQDDTGLFTEQHPLIQLAKC
jgi:hypothetical protein